MDILLQHPWESLAIVAVLVLALLGRAGRLLRITRVRRRTIVVVVRGNYDPAEVAAYILAQQAQVDGEFGPAFRIQATITLQAANVPVRPSPQAWPLYLDDAGDLPGALGYHSVDQSGVPYARVFLQDSKAAGVAWQSVASHEVVEILPNPSTTRTAIGPNGRPWAYECLTGDTEIALLDGTNVPIKDLVNREKVWVYALDQYARVQPGLARSIHKTVTDAEIVAVHLDNGKIIRCTSDHLFLLRDGSYVCASDLEPQASLMPFYRRAAPMDRNETVLYEQVYQPATNGWQWTHRVVLPHCSHGSLRHHRDRDRFNNSPENLTVVSNSEHATIHGTFPASEAKRRAHIENGLRMKKLNESHRGKHRPELCVPHNQSQEARDASGRRGAEALRAYNVTDAHREVARRVGRTAIFRNIWDDPAAVARMKERNAARFLVMNQEEWHKQLMRKNNHVRWHERRAIQQEDCELCATAKNHTVVAVLPAGRADVYDLTVDRYHNFALADGVFVHNCGDPVEDVEYLINGVPMSDFVLPRWFAPFPAGLSPVDARHAISRPYQITPGGYAQYRAADGQWVQVSGPAGRKARK